MKTFKQFILENQQNPVIDSRGNKLWYNEKGQLHRDGDLPAAEYISGTKEWYKNGELHRDGDKPAIEWARGDKWWYKNGLCCREQDKPAIERANGGKEWYKDSKRHRETGPAIILPDTTPQYFLDDNRYTKKEFETEMRRRKMLNAYKRGDTNRNVTDDLEDMGHVI